MSDTDRFYDHNRNSWYGTVRTDMCERSFCTVHLTVGAGSTGDEEVLRWPEQQLLRLTGILSW